MTQFIQTLCEGCKSIIETSNKSQPLSTPKHPTSKKLNQNKEADNQAVLQNIHSSNTRRRNSTVTALSKMNVILPFENCEFTTLGWDEYQEIKLILYSANFQGKISISLNELCERSIT